MQLTAPKLIAGFITALWGFASFLGAPNALSEQPNPVPVAREYIIEPTTTTSSTIFIDPETSACEQFSALAVNLGWPADQRTVLESIMKRESNCTPNAFNRKDPNGGSRGLLQINGSWNKWLIGKGIIAKPKDLLHAQTNLLAGLEIYNYGVERYGFGWGPWGTK
jgi:hypothetical protein